jgi:hypothetical protein
MGVRVFLTIIVFAFFLNSCQKSQFFEISGIYPHLSYYNNEGECGTGAVVPWAGKLWVVTYGPHFPNGSSDKLYEITPGLEQTIREESIGGTPANRMIHKESNQLFIGPYAIDDKGNVRAIPYDKMPGRHTGNARHLIDPESKIYYASMEEGFYEVDVNTLEINTLYPDANIFQKEGDMQQVGPLLPGAHGKGLYSGQGVMVYSNNGEANQAALHDFTAESGALLEWDGRDWTLIRRNQFVEVTGPGGIYGNENPETDPIWTSGFDFKSLLLGVRDNDQWTFYRLPKASHSYDGGHGWNTEWPRIRDIGTDEQPDYLMTMHGMFWRFPGSFKSHNTAGIRPRSAYLKVIGDFTRWGDQLVFGCDDSAQREFLNKRKAKGNIEGPGQSQSNLWFTSIEKPDQLGPGTASGAVWLEEDINANEPSDPFLFAGWPRRSVWLKNYGSQEIDLTFEVDKAGNGKWTTLVTKSLLPGNSTRIEFSADQQGEWVRVGSDKNSKVTVHFTYAAEDERSNQADGSFRGLIDAGSYEVSGGLLYGLGNNRRALGMSARYLEKDAGYYELGADMKLLPKEDDETRRFIDERFAIPRNVLSVDESSVLIIDDSDRRWRLPMGSSAFTGLINTAQLRLCREVATERDLFNCHGTFYELPAENADGYAKIRPVASHNYRIHDYASYRGLLVMTGVDPEEGRHNQHIIVSEDGKAAVWVGAIDDLWSLGKPTGKGGPWKNTLVETGQSSDPYLIGFYDKKELSLSHDLEEDVSFIVELEPVGHGDWMKYMEITVPAGETYKHIFPENFHARWIRFKADKGCMATAWLVYE